jgi:2-dehydro-3-deoxygluconokinase
MGKKAPVDQTSTEAPEVLCYGEPLVALYPDGNGADRLRITWGGDSSNTALALAKFGRRSAYLTAVSTDRFGASFLELWRSAGVDIRLVQQSETHNTGLYVASFDAGRHHLTYYRRNSAAARIEASVVNWDIVREAQLIHLSGISQAISADALELSFALMRFAHEHGILVSYDVNYRPPLWSLDRAKATIQYTAGEFADILFVTDEEMHMLGWGTEPSTLSARFARPPEYIAVKLGPGGCAVYHGSESARAAPPAVQVQDTVGAGDAFDAAFIDGVLAGRSLQDIVVFANAVAAHTCRGTGPLDMQPTRAEAENLIHSEGSRP